MIATEPRPETCSIAFKEWAGVCRALALGRQIVVLRKGGIAEGPGGFSPDHGRFWLFPTRVHEAQQGLKEVANLEPEGDPGLVEIATLLQVEAVRRIDDLGTLRGLAGEHVWTEETIRARFHYRRPGLWLLIVRAFSTPEPIAIRPTEAQAGCRSWVDLDPPIPTAGLVPALSVDAFDARTRALLRTLEPRS